MSKLKPGFLIVVLSFVFSLTFSVFVSQDLASPAPALPAKEKEDASPNSISSGVTQIFPPALATTNSGRLVGRDKPSRAKTNMYPRRIVMAKYRDHRRPLSPTQVKEIAMAVGFSEEKADEVVVISKCESGHRPRTHFDNPGTGDNSYGLMQINMINSLGPSRRAYYGLSSNNELFNPVKNLRISWRMSKNGKDWGPWTCARMNGLA